MTYQLFDRTIFLWTGAVFLCLLTVNPREALIQRVNAMNEGAVDCVRLENCSDIRSITEARMYYSILAELYPDYGRGLEMQGICYLLLKDDRLAIKKFSEAIKHNPKLFWATFELGKAYYRQGNFFLALNSFQSIIKQSNDLLLEEAMLTTFPHLPEAQRLVLIKMLPDFVLGIRAQSTQMIIGCYLHQGQIPQAVNIALDALNDQMPQSREFFINFLASVNKDNQNKEVMAWIDKTAAFTKPVLHPWGHIIPPLKELMVQ